MQGLPESFLLVRNLPVAGETFIFLKAAPTAFTFICHTNAVSEGGMGLFHAGRKSVLLVWPAGGELKACRGRCPHADMPSAAPPSMGKPSPVEQCGNAAQTLPN